MKKLFCFFILTLPFGVFGQTFGINSETKRLTYEDIIKVDSLKADEIYTKVKEWAILTFKNSEKVIVGDNKPSLVKANFVTQYFNGAVKTDFLNTITIKIRDGAIKIIIDDITAYPNGYDFEAFIYKKDGTQRTGGNYVKGYNDVESQCKSLVSNLSKFLTTDDSW